jgi:hypothetical protein
VNLFDENPQMRGDCRRAVLRLEEERARGRGNLPKAPRRKTQAQGTHAVQDAFRLAALEREELQSLRASGEAWACLRFVGAFGYGLEAQRVRVWPTELTRAPQTAPRPTRSTSRSAVAAEASTTYRRSDMKKPSPMPERSQYEVIPSSKAGEFPFHKAKVADLSGAAVVKSQKPTTGQSSPTKGDTYDNAAGSKSPAR